MRVSRTSLVMAAVLVMTGCGEKNVTDDGDEGIANNDRTTTIEDADRDCDPDAKTLGGGIKIARLKGPVDSIKVHRGGEQRITITIDRDPEFDKPLTLYFSTLVRGITVTPPEPIVPPDQNEIEVTIAADETVLGDYIITVGGESEAGVIRTDSFDLEVVEANASGEGNSQGSTNP